MRRMTVVVKACDAVVNAVIINLLSKIILKNITLHEEIIWLWGSFIIDLVKI